MTEAGLQGTSYDQYSLYLQLYYQGTVSNVDVSGLQALTFDGFLDLTRIATAGGLDVLTASRLVQFHDSGEVLIDAVYGGSYATPLPAAFAAGNIGQTWTLPQQAFLTKINVLLRNNLAGTATDNVTIYLTDNAGNIADSKTVSATITNGTDLEVSAAFPTQLAAGTWRIYVSSPNANFAWVQRLSSSPDYAGGTNIGPWQYANYDANFKIGYRYLDQGTKALISTNKVLGASANQARLYLSNATPGGSSVTPYASFDGGATWGIMAEDPTYPRPDPKFAGYTERFFTASPPGGFNQIQLKLEAMNPSAFQTPQVKRYGLIAA